MRLRLLAGAIACTALTACGSTVQVTGQAALGQDGTGLDQAGSSTAASAPTGSPDLGSSTGGGTTGGSVASGTGGGGSTGSSTTTTGSSVTSPTTSPSTSGSSSAVDYDRPATGSPVEVGIVYVPDAAAFSAALGGSGDSIGDQKAIINTAFAWTNAHGGLAGHRITPVLYPVSSTSTKSYSQSAQEICSAFTEDHKAIAGIVVGANVPNDLPNCLSKRKVLYISGAAYMHDSTDYRTLPYLVSPAEASVDRTASALVSFMVSKGAAKKGDKVGLLHMDYPAVRRAGDVVVAKLKALGISVVSTEIPYPGSTPDIAASVSAVQSAELSMASQGVKTVTFLCPGCMQFFMQDAQSQGYFPRYVFTSLDGPVSIVSSGKPKQLKDAIGITWQPVGDVPTYTKPTTFTNTTHELCKQIEKAQITSATSDYVAEQVCDAVLFVQAAAKGARTGTLNGTDLLAGINTIGTSHPSALTFAARLTPSDHAGASTYRPMHYDAGSNSMVFDSQATYPLR